MHAFPSFYWHPISYAFVMLLMSLSCMEAWTFSVLDFSRCLIPFFAIVCRCMCIILSHGIGNILGFVLAAVVAAEPASRAVRVRCRPSAVSPSRWWQPECEKLFPVSGGDLEAVLRDCGNFCSEDRRVVRPPTMGNTCSS